VEKALTVNMRAASFKHSLRGCLYCVSASLMLNILATKGDSGLMLDLVVVDGGGAVRRRTRERKVAGSTLGRGAIRSTRSTQHSIPPG